MNGRDVEYNILKFMQFSAYAYILDISCSPTKVLDPNHIDIFGIMNFAYSFFLPLLMA